MHRSQYPPSFLFSKGKSSASNIRTRAFCVFKLHKMAKLSLPTGFYARMACLSQPVLASPMYIYQFERLCK